jgi:tetratricopeptide (TPR) repeat protein
LRIYRDYYDFNHPKIAYIIEQIGYAYELDNKFGEAQRMYGRATRFYQLVYGEKHHSVARMMCRFGICCSRERSWQESVKYFQKSIELFKKINPKSMDVAGAFSHLGNMFRHQRRFKDSLKYYFKALEIYIEYGEDCPESAIICDHLAKIYDEQNNYDEALKYLNEGLRIKLLIYGDLSPYVVNSYSLIAELHRKRGEMKNCIGTLANALDISLRLFEHDDPRLADVFYELANYYVEDNDYQKAVNNFMKAEEIYSKHHNRFWFRNSLIFFRIAKLYEQRGRHQEALRNLNHTIEMLEGSQKGPTIEKLVLYESLGLVLS